MGARYAKTVIMVAGYAKWRPPAGSKAEGRPVVFPAAKRVGRIEA
jgi:hypothetical protein